MFDDIILALSNAAFDLLVVVRKAQQRVRGLLQPANRRRASRFDVGHRCECRTS